jgi:leucyl aminopeptidase
MNFELLCLDGSDCASAPTDALLVLIPEAWHVPGAVQGADVAAQPPDPLLALIAQARQSGDLDTKPGKLLQMWRATGIAPPLLLLVGAGDGTAAAVRKAVLAGVGALKAGTAQTLALRLPNASDAAVLRAAVQAVADASYVYTTTKSKPEPRKLQQVSLYWPGTEAVLHAVQSDFAVAVATVAGVELAKEWANRPANYATPRLLAEAAKDLVKSAKTSKLQCEVLGPKDVTELGMGAFLAVAQGSDEPLRLIALRYTGATKSTPPVVLVGKGITFDSGGISIKPAAEMDEMKFDMCGAASVLGVFRTLAELKPKINVIGLIPACENLPGPGAVKPGDVVTSMSGQTIEILNTDAEGRLVLCDALSYAESFKPAAVIDIATLTGACMVALGGVRHGLFSPDDGLAQELLDAGAAALDLCWRLPLDEDYAEGLKTHFADVANVAGRAGGAITAAKFLQRFATKFPWAHLDIAGTAWKSGPAKGATGRPVSLLVQYLLQHATQIQPEPTAADLADPAVHASGSLLARKGGKGGKKLPPTASADEA